MKKKQPLMYVPPATDEAEDARLDTLRRVIRVLGGQKEVARILGITQGAVSIWLYRHALGPKVQHALILVECCAPWRIIFTPDGGRRRVRFEDLRPDVTRRPVPTCEKNKADLAASVI